MVFCTTRFAIYALPKQLGICGISRNPRRIEHADPWLHRCHLQQRNSICWVGHVLRNWLFSSLSRGKTITSKNDTSSILQPRICWLFSARTIQDIFRPSQDRHSFSRSCSQRHATSPAMVVSEGSDESTKRKRLQDIKVLIYDLIWFRSDELCVFLPSVACLHTRIEQKTIMWPQTSWFQFILRCQKDVYLRVQFHTNKWILIIYIYIMIYITI